MQELVTFTVNNKPVELKVDSDRALLWVLRADLGLTGTKYGCGESYCGACTILMDGDPVRSCQLPVKDIKGKKIITIEGLENNGILHPLQKAFMENDALQCGYCTPGMIMSAYGLLKKNPAPSYSEIVEAMDDNLCRCGTYNRIIESIQTAATELKGGL